MLGAQIPDTYWLYVFKVLKFMKKKAIKFIFIVACVLNDKCIENIFKLGKLFCKL